VTSEVPENSPQLERASTAGRREWMGLGVLALPCLLYSMDLTVLNLAVPALSRELAPSSTQLLWIVDIYGFLATNGFGFFVNFGALLLIAQYLQLVLGFSSTLSLIRHRQCPIQDRGVHRDLLRRLSPGRSCSRWLSLQSSRWPPT
jgi:hypothetical protein